MKKVKNIFMIGLIAFAYGSSAQILKPLPVQYSNENTHKNIFPKFVINERIIMFSETSVTNYMFRFTAVYSLKCTLPQEAIFCRMEDAIYNHLNFWVKFRMGTDDRYSN
jgi:hypothetical protein